MSKFHVDKNIARAKTIAKDFYLDPEVFESSKQKIFSSSYQFIGNADDLTENGSALPFILLKNYLDEPLLLTRDKDGKLHCVSNVCTHRGNLLVNESCKLHKLTCKYHGRQFGLDGKFLSMPQFKEVENFPTEDDNLHSLPVYQLGKLIFTNLTSSVSPDLFFAEIKQRMSWFPMDKLKQRKDLTKTFTVKANWALYCENYLEGFHIPFVHAELNEVLDFSKYTTEIFRYSNLQTGIAKEGEMCFDLPSSSPDYGKKIAAYYFWVFPNMMFNFYPWGLSLNIVEPVSPDETRVGFYPFVLDEKKLNTGAGGDLNTVELEDEEIVENVQRGIRSRFYKHGRYSVTREQGTHHFHSLLAEFISKK
ncbi:MAG: aromatic ring-hydroxylating dioxygenase subunit alpha [Flavobacteriales bacterium]